MENTLVGRGISPISTSEPHNTKEPAPLQMAFADNQGAIDDLASALEILFTRIQPVSSKPSETKGADGAVNQPGSSSAVHALTSRTAQIAGLARLVREQTQLLEV